MKQENVNSEVDEEKSTLLANQELSDEARGRACRPIMGEGSLRNRPLFLLPFVGLVFGHETSAL